MEQVFNLKQAGAFVGLGPDMLIKMIKRGDLRAIQPGGPGGSFYVPHSEIVRLQAPLREQK